MRTCDVAEPISGEYGACEQQTNCHCFGCGASVCKACSIIREWAWYKRKRICASCHETDLNFEKRKAERKAAAAATMSLAATHLVPIITPVKQRRERLRYRHCSTCVCKLDPKRIPS
jgi:hypothetical protein